MNSIRLGIRITQIFISQDNGSSTTIVPLPTQLALFTINVMQFFLDVSLRLTKKEVNK